MILRVVTAALCLFSAFGATFAITRVDEAALPNTIATKLISGDRFSLGTLQNLDLAVYRNRLFCDPLRIRSLAIIQLKLYEFAIEAADIGTAQEAQNRFQSLVDDGLKCSPTDAFLWFAKYWEQTLTASETGRRLSSLEQSYLRGPFEGWLAVRRNIFSLAIFDTLPNSLQKRVVDEFVAMVSSGLIDDASRSFLASNIKIRSLLAARLIEAPPAMRHYFSNKLVSSGLIVEIPGITLRQPFLKR